MTTPSEHDGLNLPGYSLVARLGAGGYGEVWLAHAPGGLTKAVKFIYGSYHEKRAEHELRALQRIKDLRHPFLLSLERIEVVDGRLVIVTELAEGSLKDRFDQCRQQGLPGVPRDELLKYLRDAADALDFLSQKHSLQHLDVKPENLLLVAGHVKVADFGLVKDVGNSQASLVGGLTPLYSAPEVFQGNPSPYSDQYGLAVLYQEMLTGVLPFSGVTAAELTLQHLHDEPDLAALPITDRYVLARALAKEPSQRFAGSSEMIQALLTGGGAEAEVWSQPPRSDANQPEFAALAADAPASFSAPERRPTECFDEPFDNASSQVSTSMLLDVEPRADVAPTCLPPLDAPADPCHAQPTLVIGVGGVAAAVLRQLRLRLTRQFGEEAPPAIQMLLLDSDPKSIAHAVQGDPRAALKADETLALPLRRPQEYREQSARLMRWLSRRWLYNIPRSLRTEGMRPLGRLAFADHARQAVQRIRMALSQAAAPESIALSRDTTGLEFTGPGPRVYVVASISGGAGSGMSLDVACAVRAVLEKMNAADARVLGVFLHAQGRDARRCDLAKVNAFSWLTEFNHFQRPGGAYPGDESCGLPALARPALDSAYLVDLGADSEEDGGLEQAAQSIAEYLYLDAFTPAQTFFDRCRREANGEPTAAASLRTFSLHKIPAATDEAIDQTAAFLSREVVLRWAGGDPHAMSQCAVPTVRDTNQIVQGAAKLVSQMQLKLDGLASNSRSLVEAQFGGDQQAFLESLLATSLRDGRYPAPAELLAAVDRLFAPPGDAEPGAFVLERPVEAIVSPLVMKLAGDLARWVLAKLDDRQERLAGAQRAVDWLVEHLKRVEEDAARMSAGLARQIAAAAEETRRDVRPEAAMPDVVERRALAYFRMRIDQQAVVASGAIARRLLTELKTIGQTIAEFGRHLKHLAGSLPRTGEQDAAPATNDPLTAALAQHGPGLADAIDAQIQEEFIATTGGLFQTIMGNSRIRSQMLVVLSKLSRRAAEQLAARPDVMNAAFAAIAGGASPTSGGGVHALPTFLQSGGVFRSLTVVPVECPGSQAAKLCHGALDSESTVLVAPGHDVVAVCEGWQLPLVNLAIDLINNRRDYADFAARVQTRSDVAWMPLTSPAARQPIVNAFADFAAGTPTVTQVL